jgi:signal transduction histidine kinase
MESLFWLLANRTAETQFIFNLFHLLLAGLTLLVLLYQFKAARGEAANAHDWLLALGFLLLVLSFGLLALYFGAGFFFHRKLVWTGLERLSHGLIACGFLVVVAAHLRGQRNGETHLARWSLRGCAIVAVILLADILLSSPHPVSGELPHSVSMLVTDLLVLIAVGLGVTAVLRSKAEGKRPILVALVSAGLVVLLHALEIFMPQPAQIFVWNAEQHVLSVSLFAFAWAAGEHSRNLLDRVFVRLNLAFIVLASALMLITAGMEKHRYLQLAEERSMNLAEFLRGHTVYYQAQGESPEDIFHHPEVLKRVVVEFGTLPELRQVNVYLDGQRVSFGRTQEWEIEEGILSLAELGSSETGTELVNSFQMIRLPIESGTDRKNRIEFLGTMDYINEYIGKYIALIYSLFTVIVLLATGIIGMIVADTDRRLRQQYAELEGSQQRLAQAAKLASIGQLAAGMAHEINNPITSVLSLASHLTDGKGAATLAPVQRRSLQLMAQQAERVSKIVRNLLIFARKSQLELSWVDVGEPLHAAITLAQYRLQECAICLRQEIEVALPLILGDPGRLTEVFVNLLNNAIDAMPAGGTLTIHASLNVGPEGGVRVEVADTGCGIPPDQLPSIFDPFFTTKEPGRGTGLGLSISHGIVKDHSGQIWAESRPGGGTTVVVTLPKEVSRDESMHPGDR